MFNDSTGAKLGHITHIISLKTTLNSYEDDGNDDDNNFHCMLRSYPQISAPRRSIRIADSLHRTN